MREKVSEKARLLHMLDAIQLIQEVVRNILVHEYFGINYDIIWQAIIDKIPVLKIKVESVLQQMSFDRE